MNEARGDRTRGHRDTTEGDRREATWSRTDVNRREIVRTGAGVGMVALAGCLDTFDSDPPVEAVEVALTDVREPETGLTTATIPVVVGVENTADEEVPSPTVDYTVFLNGERVASARETVATLGGGDRTTITIEVTAEYASIGAAIVDAIESGDIHTEINGEIESDGATSEFASEYTYSH